jgi:hypothetical protein
MIDMKKLIFLLLFLPFLFITKAKAQFTITNTSTITLAELRTGDWPLELQRVVKESDTIYLLSFRDKQYPNSVNISTLKFGDLTQLKYFQKGLSALKSGSNGDEAKFKSFSIKRTDVKKTGTKYVLTCTDEGDVTDIQQTEADTLVKAIKSL